jgi:hypothetical protein
VRFSWNLFFFDPWNVRFTLLSHCGFIYSSAHTKVTRPLTALMSMISSRYTGLVLIRSLNLLINIAFTMWRISVITFKHENNIFDNGRHTWSGYTVTNQHKPIHQHHSILKRLVPNRLLYDEDIRWWLSQVRTAAWTSTLRCAKRSSIRWNDR